MNQNSDELTQAEYEKQENSVDDFAREQYAIMKLESKAKELGYCLVKTRPTPQVSDSELAKELKEIDFVLAHAQDDEVSHYNFRLRASTAIAQAIAALSTQEADTDLKYSVDICSKFLAYAAMNSVKANEMKASEIKAIASKIFEDDDIEKTINYLKGFLPTPPQEGE